MNNNKECAKYFKSRRAYKRCFEEFRKKWKSYGKVAGIITLHDASEEERRAIGGVAGKVFYEKDIRFSFAEFEQGLQRTHYAPVDMKDVLEEYFGEKLATNKREKEEGQEKKSVFLDGLRSCFAENAGEESMAFFWIQGLILTKKYGYKILTREFAEDAAQAEMLAKNIGNALVKIEHAKRVKSRSPLAVFAANVSGNPHYFDRSTTAGQLLVNAICYCENTEIPENAYKWRELLVSVGIVPDNVSSMLHSYGLRLRTKEGWHPAYEAFCKLKEPCVITMENLRGIIGADTVGGKVYVVENEMVFSYLIENVREENLTLLCTSGQLRTVALEVLAFIFESGARVYYSGDIDSDGIGIADRLWQKFGDNIQIWRMSPADYEKSLSNESIGDIGISKLENIKHPLLRKTAEYMKERRLAAYQENMLEDLLGDIK